MKTILLSIKTFMRCLFIFLWKKVLSYGRLTSFGCDRAAPGCAALAWAFASQVAFGPAPVGPPSVPCVSLARRGGGIPSIDLGLFHAAGTRYGVPVVNTENRCSLDCRAIIIGRPVDFFFWIIKYLFVISRLQCVYAFSQS